MDVFFIYFNLVLTLANFIFFLYMNHCNMGTWGEQIKLNEGIANKFDHIIGLINHNKSDNQLNKECINVLHKRLTTEVDALMKMANNNVDIFNEHMKTDNLNVDKVNDIIKKFSIFMDNQDDNTNT